MSRNTVEEQSVTGTLTIDDVMRHLGGAREHDSEEHRELVRALAGALEAVLTARPLWSEAMTVPSFDGDALTEIRAIGPDSLVTVTAAADDPFSDGGPLVQIQSLGDVSGIDLDRFALDEHQGGVGCSVTLRFDRGASVRLGSSGDGARRALLAFLPDLVSRVRGLQVAVV